jgi:lysophospholipase L1-like esterase
MRQGDFVKAVVYVIYLGILFLGASLLFELVLAHREKFEYIEATGADRAIRLKENRPSNSREVTPSETYLAQTYGLKETLGGRPSFLLRTDEDGYLLPKQFGSGKKKITLLFLGGSTTETLYVREDLRWPALTGKLIAQEEGISVTILNGGVAGANSYHSIFSLLAKGIKHKPDFVILNHNINDLTYLAYNGDYLNNNKDCGGKEIIVNVESPKDLPGFQIFFPRTWYYFHNLHTNVKENGAKEKIDIKPEHLLDFWTKVRKDSEGEIQAKFRRNLRHFVQLGKLYGFTPVLVKQAFLYHRDETLPYIQNTLKRVPALDVITAMHKEFNNAVLDVAKETGTPLIDLSGLDNKDYLYDLMHFNEKGSRSAAHLVHQDLQKHWAPERKH